MTQNQIAYHNALELKRHNIATEAENKRHSMIEEGLKQRSNELAAESNTITKQHYERQDAINAMHYERSDTLNELLASETYRSNVASEQIRRQQNAINAAGIAESVRHQKAMEQIEGQLAKNTIYKTQADVSYTTANTGLVRAKTMTEKFQPDYVINQTDLVRAQRVTESYKPVQVMSQSLSNIGSTVNSIINAASKLAVVFR